MIKTPTWHVFDLFKEHQDAQLVESYIETKSIGEEEAYMVPNLSESVSIDSEGRLQITGFAQGTLKATGRILAGDMHDKNTFEAPDAVVSKPFAVETVSGGLAFTIPPCSVVQITVEA